MIQLVHFFIRQRLFNYLLVVLLALGGSFSLSQINREFLPEVNFDMGTILTVYPGASPDEIEQLITIPLEKEIRSVSGVDRVTSSSLENISFIAVYLVASLREQDKRRAINDIKDAMDSVTDLPDNAELPIFEEVTTENFPVVDLAITYRDTPEARGRNTRRHLGMPDDENYRAMRDLALLTEDLVYDVNGVATVERYGYLEREYLVEVEPSQMNRYNVGMNTFMQKIGERNINLPSGFLRVDNEEFLLRTMGRFRSAAEIAQVPIQANEVGFVTRVGDLALVSDTFEEPRILERYNGEPAIVLRVLKRLEADIIDVVDDIEALIPELEERYPQFEFNIFNNASTEVKNNLASLIVNAGIGLTLLLISLFLLLGVRLSFLVSSVIPIVLMIAMMVMLRIGLTLNIISIFGLVMVLGMIVDFAIVVSENAYRHLQNGKEKVEATEISTSEVFWPVTVAVLVTVSAFAPLAFMTGIIGKFVLSIPLVIIISLIAAWVHAMFILPSQLAMFLKLPRSEMARKNSLESGESETSKDYFRIFQDLYVRTLRVALRFRYSVMAAATVAFLVLIPLGAWLTGFVLFPPGGEDYFEVRSELPQGTRLSKNLEVAKTIETVVREVTGDEFRAIRTRIGVEEPTGADPTPREGTHRSHIVVQLSPSHERSTSADDFVEIVRNRIAELQNSAEIPENMTLDVRPQRGGPPVGMPVSVEIRGAEFDELEKISGLYIDKLRQINGVYDIRSSLEDGKREFRFRVLEDIAASAGLSVLDIASAIRTAFNGEIATVVNEGEDEIEVRVMFPEDARERFESIQRVSVANQMGMLIPLSRVAVFEEEAGFSQINRLNFRRLARVEANVNTDINTSVAVNRELADHFSNITEDFPEYSVNYGGEQEDAMESIQNLMISFLFAMIVIYIILAVFFNSTLKPMVIMNAIPFGMIGVILGLLLHQAPLSFMSLLGAVSLSGVIVSNTLVLVSFIEYLKKEGYNTTEALIEAGARRLRPVILTTATTVLGLLPSVYGIAGTDHFVQPLAQGFSYGLIFGTFITLVLTPVFYYIAEDFRGFIFRKIARFLPETP